MSTDGQSTKCHRNISKNCNRLSTVHKHYRRQTDRRQTDGRQHIVNANVSSRLLKSKHTAQVKQANIMFTFLRQLVSHGAWLPHSAFSCTLVHVENICNERFTGTVNVTRCRPSSTHHKSSDHVIADVSDSLEKTFHPLHHDLTQSCAVQHPHHVPCAVHHCNNTNVNDELSVAK